MCCVVSIPAGPSKMALQDCACGLARYAAISQVCISSSLLKTQLCVSLRLANLLKRCRVVSILAGPCKLGLRGYGFASCCAALTRLRL